MFRHYGRFLNPPRGFPSTSDRSPSAIPSSHEKDGSPSSRSSSNIEVLAQTSSPVVPASASSTVRVSTAELSVTTSTSAAPISSPNSILSSCAAVPASSAAVPDPASSSVGPPPASSAALASTAAVPISNVASSSSHAVPASSSNAAVQHLISRAVQQNSATNKGKPIEEAQSLPECCPICLENLNEGDQSEAMPCAVIDERIYVQSVVMSLDKKKVINETSPHQAKLTMNFLNTLSFPPTNDRSPSAIPSSHEKDGIVSSTDAAEASSSSGAVQQCSGTNKGKAIEEAQSSPECPICLENLNEGDQSEALPCAHVFHQHCLTKWLTVKNACPICRNVVGHKNKSDQPNQPTSSQNQYEDWEYHEHAYPSSSQSSSNGTEDGDWNDWDYQERILEE
ncbi:hypothetical protein niasHT_014194 [Heterodera trifolii]|uniref:RING-type E3 ubiquitin transferase n=1 Tax=Heterodera trifolii TaxID=157864 RepID=A0ABD2KX18_9BILA